MNVNKAKTHAERKAKHDRMCCVGEGNPIKTPACWCMETCCWEDTGTKKMGNRVVSTGRCICKYCDIHIMPRPWVAGVVPPAKRKKVKA